MHQTVTLFYDVRTARSSHNLIKTTSIKTLPPHPNDPWFYPVLFFVTFVLPFCTISCPCGATGGWDSDLSWHPDDIQDHQDFLFHSVCLLLLSLHLSEFEELDINQTLEVGPWFHFTRPGDKGKGGCGRTVRLIGKSVDVPLSQTELDRNDVWRSTLKVWCLGRVVNYDGTFDRGGPTGLVLSDGRVVLSRPGSSILPGTLGDHTPSSETTHLTHPVVRLLYNCSIPPS